MKYALIILILFSIMVSACTSKPAVVDDGRYVPLAKCLTEKGAVMYGTEWCPHCQNQKKAFGSAFDYVTFVDCDKEMDRCKAAGVTGYPTWVIAGNNYAGEQNFYDLAKNSNCTDKLV